MRSFYIFPIFFIIIFIFTVIRAVKMAKKGREIKNMMDQNKENLQHFGDLFNDVFKEAEVVEPEKEKQYECEYCQGIIKESQTKCPNCGAMRKTTKD